jgi:hypothetical protein
MRPSRFASALCLIVVLFTGRHAAAAEYALDAIPRTLKPGEALPCVRGTIPLISYRGAQIRYQKPVRIHPAFESQLRAFEELVAELAVAHYGRIPRRLVHLGGYNCRVMRLYPDYVSEHALGNAIDLAGFDFAPIGRRDARAAGLAPALRGAFHIRLAADWQAKGSAHAAFLRALAAELARRPEIFRVLLGPGYPGHHNHLHLDHAPYRLVDYDPR